MSQHTFTASGRKEIGKIRRDCYFWIYSLFIIIKSYYSIITILQRVACRA
jgi:hypothetical protein